MMMHAPATSTTVVVSTPTVVYVNFNPMWGACCRPETNPPEGPFDRNDYSLHLQPYMSREEYQDAIDSINYTYRQTGLGARSKFTMSLFFFIGFFFTLFIIAGVVGVADQAPAFPLTVFGCLFVFIICTAVIYHRKSAEAIAKLRQMIASINAQYSSRSMQWRFVVQTTTTHDHHHHHHHGHHDHHHHRRTKTTWWIEIELGVAATTTTTVSYPGVPAPVDPYAQYPPPPAPHPSQPYPPQPSPYEQHPYPPQQPYPPQPQQPYPPHPGVPQPPAPYPPQQPYPPQPSPYDQQGYPPQQPYPPQPQPQQPPQPFATPAPVDPSFQQQGYAVPPQQPQQPNLLDLDPVPPQK